VDSNQRVSALTEALREQIRNTNAPEQQALLQIELQRVRANAKSDRSRFLDPDLRVVCTTMFNAVRMLDQFHVRQVIESGQAPFTTIFIDEAGMVSRAALAALSLLAAHRVVLVGDGRQLSPISVTSGLLPSNQQVWLGCSGLADLNQTDDLPDAIHLLTQQRRMHPAICNVVSRYQYNGTLTTASERVQTKQQIPDSIAAHGPAMWYVLDAESCNLAMIRASRDRNGGSWIRERSFDIVRRLLGDDEIAKSNGLYVSPFAAQAKRMADCFVQQGLRQWKSSTVHSQQGCEADIVLFDPVNAGSTGWDVLEWQRLINVAISRARNALIVIASRSEMDEPHMRALREGLTPVTLDTATDRLVSLKSRDAAEAKLLADARDTIRETT
ncbi:MAG: AAA domain-containing protein, partial [Planctomycetota bacterium]